MIGPLPRPMDDDEDDDDLVRCALQNVISSGFLIANDLELLALVSKDLYRESTGNNVAWKSVLHPYVVPGGIAIGLGECRALYWKMRAAPPPIAPVPFPDPYPDCSFLPPSEASPNACAHPAENLVLIVNFFREAKSLQTVFLDSERMQTFLNNGEVECPITPSLPFLSRMNGSDPDFFSHNWKITFSVYRLSDGSHVGLCEMGNDVEPPSKRSRGACGVAMFCSNDNRVRIDFIRDIEYLDGYFENRYYPVKYRIGRNMTLDFHFKARLLSHQHQQQCRTTTTSQHVIDSITITAYVFHREPIFLRRMSTDPSCFPANNRPVLTLLEILSVIQAPKKKKKKKTKRLTARLKCGMRNIFGRSG